MIKGHSTVNVSNINGKPTHAFIFKWNFANSALSVFKSNEGRRVVSWLDQNEFQRPNKGGPEVTKSLSGQNKAQVANPKGKAHFEEDEISYPSVLIGTSTRDQSASSFGREFGVIWNGIDGSF